MNILVIGSGGREHAICRNFAKSPKVTRLYCANGNAGIAAIAECVPISPDAISELAAFAQEAKIDLTFVGGETPLALGIVDEFEARGLRIVGPGKQATRLESSKSFAKDFMARHGIPTARYAVAHSPGFAVAELESGNFGSEATPVVVKADGLAAGKGVVMAPNRAEAIMAINDLAELVGMAAAATIVLEECLIGKEVSLLMFADGEDFYLMPPTRDHKRIGENDTGPNTGGMGTFTDASLLSSEDMETIVAQIVRPTLHGCSREGFPFRGILFLGLMMTAEGPKLLEYNVRFGDPETQSILVRLETDLVDICEAVLSGRLGKIRVNWRPGSSACVVMAAAGYPMTPQTGDVINGLDRAKGVVGVEVFHAGTARSGTDIITAGGRVLGIAATGKDLETALTAAYAGVDQIEFAGMQVRRDIGGTAKKADPA